MAKKTAEPTNVGVINPFALAELMAGKKIDWTQEDPREVLSETLHVSYEKLFDPMNAPTLYAGLKLNTDTLEMERAEQMQPPRPVSDAGLVTDEVDEIELRNDDNDDIHEVRPEQVVAGVSGAATWLDPGNVMKEAVEMSDPVQGALGDCYFIAGLSSVAWARTYAIAHWTRATGLSNDRFVDMVPFYDTDGTEHRIEVTEELPLNPPTNSFIFARSSELGEIWPAIWEKAYAKWRTQTAGDHPDYYPIAGGDPVRACQEIIGGTRHYEWTRNLSADTIWSRVRQHCLSRKTFDPMVAWTYPSGAASPDKVNYSNAHLVANHAYSILGWDYVDRQKYLVIRNPWGSYEATEDILGGSWYAWDAPYYGGPGWWRRVDLAQSDGVFSIKTATFKKYFAGFGWISGGKK